MLSLWFFFSNMSFELGVWLIYECGLYTSVYSPWSKDLTFLTSPSPPPSHTQLYAQNWGRSRIFLKRGCTRKEWRNWLFLCRIPVVLESHRSYWRGVCTPCTLPLDPPLQKMSPFLQAIPQALPRQQHLLVPGNKSWMKTLQFFQYTSMLFLFIPKADKKNYTKTKVTN